MSIEKNLKIIRNQIKETADLSGRKDYEITLVAVTKGRSLEEMKEAYFLGIRDFGENRVDEALVKMEQLPSDIRWHFIGNLQKNKVHKILGKFALIHSVDTAELAEKISLLSLENGLKTSILLQANTSGELTKSGLSSEGWKSKFRKLSELNGIIINGLMTIAPLTEDESRIRRCFSELSILFQQLRALGRDFKVLSMGMTNDFPIAIQEGSTLVRIGTALFTPLGIN